MRRWIFTCGCVTLLFLLRSFALGAELSSPSQAQPTDTIRLKNGSIIHGVVVRFEDGVFTIVIPGTQSRAMVHMNDIERIEFVENSSAPPSQGGQATSPVERQEIPPPPEQAKQTTQVQEDKTKPSPSPPPSQEKAQLESSQTQPSTTQQQEADRLSGQREENKSSASSPPKQEPAPVTAPPTQIAEKPLTQTVTTSTEPPETKPTTPVETPATGPVEEKKTSTRTPKSRELTVTIPGREVWADSGVDISRGDRLRLTASGRINLSRNQATGPEGVNISDPGKMMPNRPTGGLIAVIGDDNDDFMFIGASAEFVATRSGRLFLMANENNLEDNSGAFTVRIRVQSSPAP